MPCPANGHFGTFQWCGNTNDQAKWQAVHDLLFTSISLVFWDTDNICWPQGHFGHFWWS